MIRKITITTLALIGSAGLAGAQEPEISAPCARAEVPDSARDFCYTVAQAVESAQPQLGILIAGGNPTIGTATMGGINLPGLPRVNASAQVNVVFARLPDILAEEAGGAIQDLNEAVGLPAPALSGTVALGLYPGISLAPTIGGIGSVDVLGSGTWLPFRAVDAAGFGEEAAEFAYGGGVRLGLLGESFTLPGISISGMYRRLDKIWYGNVCENAPAPPLDMSDGYSLNSGICAGSGDPGEFGFDLTNWSGRAVASKSFFGIGLSAGVGYDRFESTVNYGFRAPAGDIPGQENYFVRAEGIDLDNDRWSAFVDGSMSLLVATLAVEAGWLQGEEAITGFDTAVSEFDPGDGTFFGSLGMRFSF